MNEVNSNNTFENKLKLKDRKKWEAGGNMKYKYIYITHLFHWSGANPIQIHVKTFFLI